MDVTAQHWADTRSVERISCYFADEFHLNVEEELHALTTVFFSNLRPTTSECVHLVTRGHFRSPDKDGGHTVRSAISKNPMLHANFLALCTEPAKVLHCGNKDFSNFFACVTLTLTR